MVSKIFCEAPAEQRVSQTQGDHSSETLCRPTRAQCVEPAAKPLEVQVAVCSETHALSDEVTHRYYLRAYPRGEGMFSVRDANMSGVQTRQVAPPVMQTGQSATSDVVTDHQRRANNRSTRKPWWDCSPRNQGGRRSRSLGRLQRSSGLHSPYLGRTVPPEKSVALTRRATAM